MSRGNMPEIHAGSVKKHETKSANESNKLDDIEVNLLEEDYDYDLSEVKPDEALV